MQVTIRASHPHHHTTSGFACPDGPGSTSNQISVGILNSKLVEVLAVNKTAATMRVGAGMTVKQFQRLATRRKLSVQLGSLPAYAGLTLGGLLATTGHGTGLGVTGAFEDTVIQVTWVSSTATHESPQYKSPFAIFLCQILFSSAGAGRDILPCLAHSISVQTAHIRTHSIGIRHPFVITCHVAEGGVCKLTGEN